MKKFFLLFLLLINLTSCFSAYHTGREAVGIKNARRDYSRTDPCPQCLINLSGQEAWDIFAFPISIPMIIPSFLGGFFVGGISRMIHQPNHVEVREEIKREN